MITRIAIDNLVIVEHAELEPGPGLTVVTGETGAGKTLLATAISVLFGGPADARLVGANGAFAWVEGEFDPVPSFWDDPVAAPLRELRPDDDSPLVLARKVERSGRSRALAWGRTITKGDLAAAGELLLRSIGQHAGRDLVATAHQRAIVDAFGDEQHHALVTTARDRWDDYRSAERELARLEEAVSRGAVDIERTRDDLERIDAVNPSIEEFDHLTDIRGRVQHRAQLAESLGAALRHLRDDGGAIERTGAAWRDIDTASTLDPSLADLAATCLSLQEQLADAVRSIDSTVAELGEDATSAEDVEARLAAYDEVIRRHGGTVASVIAAREHLARELDVADDGAAVIAAATEARDAALNAATSAADDLREARRALAGPLADAIAASLRELGMEHSTFTIDVTDAPLGAAGSDTVELRLSPSDALEPRPLAAVASGGELSRIALGILVASRRRTSGTIVFDEIDAGIGGRTAHAVASLLRRLAEQNQVICITHLPQVAARARTHVVVEKHGAATTLHALTDEDAVLDELCRMLGAQGDDDAARAHAASLRGTRIAGPTSSATNSSTTPHDLEETLL